MHGGAASGWTWQLQVEGLPQYHCLVPGLSNHGRSLAAYLPHGKVFQVEGVSHNRSLEAPHLFTNTVCARAGSQPLPSRLESLCAIFACETKKPNRPAKN